MRFATLSISLMILIVTTLPLTVSAQAREETATGISARQRWDALSVEKRHELVRIHKALKSLPEKQRNQLIKRLRELPPEDSKKLVQRLREFMGSSAQHRRDVRRRRTAFQLWDFQPAVVLGKTLKPRCFRKIYIAGLPVKWYANKKTWTTGNIFCD
jgi:hypothetical protein